MSISHDIKKMLGIIDKNLQISKVDYEKYKNKQTLMLVGKLSPEVHQCSTCGFPPLDSAGKQTIVKNGSKISMIRLNAYNQMPTILKLAKQRYFCKNCESHWTAQSYFVNPRCQISKQIQFKVIELLKERISMTLIAQLCHVSITSVIRILQGLTPYLPDQGFKTLPKVLMVDEFRSHTSIEDKMSFICADGESGELVTILSSRKLPFLISHFSRYANPEQVKFLVTDMNAAYFELIPKVFKNAELVIDRFHVVQHLNRAFNQFRVREMKKLLGEKKVSEANKMKANWRKYLKNEENINHSEYKAWRSFPTSKFPLLTESMMVHRLVSFSESLGLAYRIFQNLIGSFKKKKHTLFFEQLLNLPDTLDTELRTTFENLLSYQEGIRNSLIYSYSNGKLEAKNTHIKTLKRVSYGFKSFYNMKTRIFLTEGLIKIK